MMQEDPNRSNVQKIWQRHRVIEMVNFRVESLLGKRRRGKGVALPLTLLAIKSTARTAEGRWRKAILC